MVNNKKGKGEGKELAGVSGSNRKGKGRAEREGGTKDKGKSLAAGDGDGVRAFTQSEVLKMISANCEEIIGRGGTGTILLGMLDAELVAIKKVEDSSVYNNEVKLLQPLCHQSVVRMIGFCNRVNSIVLAYAHKGSLHDWLGGLGQKQPLEWNDRVKIALSVAKGLEYLHCDITPSLIHRDLKPANILLEDDMSAKITDFGLAVVAPNDGGHLSFRGAVGTAGYICPEYQKTGKCSTQSDIFSYGMVLLGLVCGREADESNSEALQKWACNLDGDFTELADPKLKHYDQTSFRVIAGVAVGCLAVDPSNRPCIKDILKKFKKIERPPEKSSK